jgi:hypothetical protein
MAQPKPERISLEQILRLVDQLQPDEQEELRRNLNNKDWGKHFHQLCDEIEATRLAKGLPRLTDEEIMTEVKAVREEMQAERDQSSR